MTIIDRDGRWLTPLSIPEGQKGNMRIEHMQTPPGTPMMLVPARTAYNRGDISQVTNVAWTTPTTWHTLRDDDGVWTTDMPCEIEQQQKLLEGMSGRILIGGLGIGLVATLLGRERDVRRMTVVEQSQDVVDLVLPHLHFPGGALVTVATADLFEFLEAAVDQIVTGKLSRPDFDWAFYDIWRSDGEWTLYKTVWRLRDLTRACGLQDDRIVNWNEDVMQGQVRNSFFFVLNATRALSGLDVMDAESMTPEVKEWFEKSKGMRSMAMTRERVENDHVPPLQRWFWRTYYKEGLDRADDKTVEALMERYCSTFGWASWERRFGVRPEEYPWLEGK